MTYSSYNETGHKCNQIKRIFFTMNTVPSHTFIQRISCVSYFLMLNTCLLNKLSIHSNSLVILSGTQANKWLFFMIRYWNLPNLNFPFTLLMFLFLFLISYYLPLREVPSSSNYIPYMLYQVLDTLICGASVKNTSNPSSSLVSRTWHPRRELQRQAQTG